MSSILEDRQHKALKLVLDNYQSLWNDLNEGKISVDQLKDKHEMIFDETTEQVEKFLELPSPELIIEICDGEIQGVHSIEPITYAVYDPDAAFDPYVTHEATPFKNYKDAIEEIEATYITEADLS